MPKTRARIGVIGGSGLYALDDLDVIDEVKPRTPFGKPSDKIVVGRVAGHNVAFLPRHGRGHRVLPTEVPSRANIAALKSLGVEKIIAFSAVGSLKEKLAPLDFCIPSQVIDRTRLRHNTFFGHGVVGHVTFADPFSKPMCDVLYRHARRLGLKAHRDETLVCMEGPAFSSRAESNLYRSWGAGLINMSALPESKLAREAEIAYGLVCMITDYDCWREEDDDVDIQMVIDNLNKNAENAKRLLRSAIEDVAATQDPAVRTASQFAIITQRDLIPKSTWKKLRYLFPDYFDDRKKGSSKKERESRKDATPSTAESDSKKTKTKRPAKKSSKKKTAKKKATKKKTTTERKTAARKPSVKSGKKANTGARKKASRRGGSKKRAH